MAKNPNTKIRLEAIAYFKGVYDCKTTVTKPANPYKKERLQICWDAGYEDQKSGLIHFFDPIYPEE